MKRISILALALAIVLPAWHAPAALAQAPAPPADLAPKLAAVEQAVEAGRRELGIPGASLVVVKDDQIVFMKGFGLRDVGKQLPVTPDTLFAIGSSTKAFTSMAVAIAADDGKLSLDDRPSKYLPFFKLQDPDADAKITIRDLLCHRSGLNRTDIAWYSNALTRDEVIQVASRAKATAKLGEKFQYQNVMFMAAGVAAARAENTTYERFVTDRLFKPLGMKSTTFSVPVMQKARDHSLGYDYNFSTKETRVLPTRDLTVIAPAGAINSSARDMAEWLRLMLGGGAYKGKRVVSEAGYAELVKPQMKVGGNVDYGLGWFLRDWHGHKVVEHGGNIDGFNAQVAFMPDQHVGLVLLTNVSASTLGTTAMNAVWTNLVGDPNADTAAAASPDAPAVDPKAEAGVYAFPQAGFDVTVDMTDGHLTMAVPGQPTYPLENVGGRRYKLGAPAPAGFFVTFRAAKDNPSSTEAYLEQPQGNYVLPRKVVGAKPSDSGDGAALAELVGTYADKDKKGSVEIANLNGNVSLVVPGQPPYPLVKKADDVFALGGLSSDYVVTLRRAADRAVAGFSIKQPNGTFEFDRMADAKPEITVDEIEARAVKAAGGEANLRRHTSSVIQVDLDFVHQGIQGHASVYAKAPAMSASEATLTALGKTLGTIHSYFDGAAGGNDVSFATPSPFTGKQLVDAKAQADFYEPLKWKELYETVVVKGKRDAGGEECYVVVKTPKNGNPVTDFYSARTFLLVRRDTLEWSETAQVGTPETTLYSDYRVVDGVSLPYKAVATTTASGDVVTTIKSVAFDVKIPDAVFAKK